MSSLPFSHLDEHVVLGVFLFVFVIFLMLNLGDEHVVFGVAAGEVLEPLSVKLLLQLHSLPALLCHQL